MEQQSYLSSRVEHVAQSVALKPRTAGACCTAEFNVGRRCKEQDDIIFAINLQPHHKLGVH